ncbi:MAG: C-type lectin domain-containing protein [Reichenbachiella sp.]
MSKYDMISTFSKTKYATIIVAYFVCIQVRAQTKPIGNFVNYDNHNYAFIHGIKPNALQAREVCKSYGMAMVKIESADENAFVLNTISSLYEIDTIDVAKQYWTGGTDASNENMWSWNGEGAYFYDQNKMSTINDAYENWGKTKLGTQPNNVWKNDEDEDCMVIRNDGSWYDIGCTKRYAFVICEQ